MARISRWSRRFDGKVVPRRYLHLYRCFGWTPTSRLATPQYDWERTQNEIRPAEKYTSADISPNLQDYDDLGLQRKELTAIKRNTKFYQYEKQYRGFFLYESIFNTLMHRYTVDKRWKHQWFVQFAYMGKRAFDFLMTVVTCVLFPLYLILSLVQAGVASGVDFVKDVVASLTGIEIVKTVYEGVEEFYQTKLLGDANAQMIGFFILAVFFFLLGSRQVWLTNKKLNAKRAKDPSVFFERKSGTPEILQVKKASYWRKHKRSIVNRYACILYIPALVCLFFGLYASGLLGGILPGDMFSPDFLAMTLYVMIGVYLFVALWMHSRLVRDANPFALILWLCLQARPATKKILLSDVSMMTNQQRQRYQQGRIIGAAVSDALDRRDQGIRDDFYIGY